MDYQRGIKFIDQIIELRQRPPWLFPLDSEEDLILVKGLLWRGEKYEKILDVLALRYGHRHTHPGTCGISTETIDQLIAKVESDYFGSKPRSQRLNEVIDRLGVYMQVGKMSEIIELLVKLRDEEEDA